jgi:soluble lytic murein transglycosylase-like protein
MRRLLMPALVAFLAVSGVVADELVIFDDGRTLEVSALEVSGDLAVLDLGDGGRLWVPLARVASVERIVPLRAEPEPAPVAALTAAWKTEAGQFAELIEATARRHGVDPVLLMAMAAVESNFDPFAVSSKGACGILQLIPATAERFGVADVFDAGQNLDGGAGYLRWLLDRFEGETELALAAYNAGENAVDRYGGIPPYPETRNYVSRVLSRRTAALRPLQASN